MIALHLLALYGATPITDFQRSGDLVYFEHHGERFVSNVWCDCATAEFAVYPHVHPLNDTGSVNVLRVCPKHAEIICHGQRLKSEAEYHADCARAREVLHRIAPGFTLNRVRRDGLPGWGDPRYHKKPEVKP
jgi:hypothetical protein